MRKRGIIPKKNIYQIMLINHGKMLRNLYQTATEEKVNKKFASMIEENRKNVVFPIEWNNHEHVMLESDYEIIILKLKDENDSDVTKLKDDYGKFINYKSSNDKWVILDRASYRMEESFWVYGYHPRLQRKDFNWIFDNFIAKDSKNKYMFKSVVLFKNKLLVDCNGKLEMVICKNKSDGIRMYNKIEGKVKEKKFKYIVFMGDVEHSKYKMSWVERIKELTHWNNKKVERSNTRP